MIVQWVAAPQSVLGERRRDWILAARETGASSWGTGGKLENLTFTQAKALMRKILLQDQRYSCVAIQPVLWGENATGPTSSLCRNEVLQGRSTPVTSLRGVENDGALGQVTTLRADHLYRWRSIANFPCSMFAVADIVQLLQNNGFTEIEVVTSATSSARAEVEALTPPWPADRIKMNIQPGRCGFWGQARWSGPDAPLDLALFQGIPSVQAVDFWDQTTTPPTAIIGPPFTAVAPPVVCGPDEFFSTTENRCVRVTPPAPGPLPPPGPAPAPPPPAPAPPSPAPPATRTSKKSVIPVVIGALTVGALLVAAVAGRPTPPAVG